MAQTLETHGMIFDVASMTLDPPAPRKKEPFVIKGKINLFKIPFLMPAWISARVTYPENFWEELIPLWGSPIVTKTDIALFGNYEIRFEDGFEREGEFNLNIQLYAGPTVQIQGPAQKGLTIPPFPAADTIETTFTVGGDLPDEEKIYTFEQPVVNPEKPVIGQDVVFDVAVTSTSDKAETVTIKCNVTEGRVLGSPGPTIKTYTSEAVLMQPNETRTFTFNHKEIEPDGMRDLEMTAIVGSKLKGYHHFDGAYAVEHEVINTRIYKAVAAPNHITPGGQVSISSDVTNLSNKARDITVKFNIYQGDITGPAGQLFATLTATVQTLQPDETKKFTVNYTAQASPVDDARRDVGVETWLGGKKIDSIQDDDIFYVENPSVDFIIMGPVANPNRVESGQPVQLSSQVTNNGNIAKDVTVKFNIYNAGYFWVASALLQTLTSPVQRLNPGETKAFSVTHTATKTAHEGRDVGVEAWVDNNKVDDLQDDNIFSVVSPITDFYITNPAASPSQVQQGQQVALSTQVTSLCTGPQDVTVKFNIYKDGFLWMSGGLIQTLQTTMRLQPNESRTFIVQHQATTGAGYRDVGLEAWVGSQKIDTQSGDSVFSVFTQPVVNFTVAKAVASPSQVQAGQQVTLSVTVESLCSESQYVQPTFNIYNSGWINLEGDKLGSVQAAGQTMAPGTVRTFTAVYMTTQTSKTGRDVGVEFSVGSKKFTRGPDDDIFQVLSTPTRVGFVIGLHTPDYPSNAAEWCGLFHDRYTMWFNPVNTPWVDSHDLGTAGESGELVVELYDANMTRINRYTKNVTLKNGHYYWYYPNQNRLDDRGMGPF